jgi:hypothetical protein
MAAMRLALARKTHRAAAYLTAAIACCAACICAGCTGGRHARGWRDAGGHDGAANRLGLAG